MNTVLEKTNTNNNYYNTIPATVASPQNKTIVIKMNKKKNVSDFLKQFIRV